jgi:methionyl-tRNA formyltransferase
MKVVLASSSDIAQPVLNALLLSNHQLVGGISMPDKPTGRGRQIQPNSFSLLCEKSHVQVFKPKNQAELAEVLRELKPDLVITIAYGRLIKASELSIPEHGWLNVHFSLLPRWRGAAPVQRAILRGDRETGISIFRLDEGMDTGPVYAAHKISLVGNETYGSLLSELALLAAPVLLTVLENIEKGSSPIPQIEDGATLAPKLSKGEARINWQKSADEIERQVRAMNPWPIAWTTVNDKRLSILQTCVHNLQGNPGEILSLEPFIIGCGEEAIEISLLKPEGRAEMSAADWLRGARISKDEILR